VEETAGVTRKAVTDCLEPEEHVLFGRVLHSLNREQVPFLLAGGYVFSHYSGFWRNTKDMDIVVKLEDFDRAVRVVLAQGLQDYYPVEGYDRSWIFRAHRGPIIVDVIHCFANHADHVDDSWLDHGVPGEFAGEPVRFIAPEDLIWMKLFVFQRQRCDWPDLLNILRGQDGALDWDYLLRRTGEHWRLLAALVEVYDWLCPGERHYIPGPLRAELARRHRRQEPTVTTRASLLDSRPWLTEPGAGLNLVPALPAPPDLLEECEAHQFEEEKEELVA
jgi:hypothetical protein